MSASEKLKALEARTGDGLIPYELEAVLPQIVGVVWAAESMGEWHDEMVPAERRQHDNLDTALRALNAALTAGGNG
jgi:hypothetical protein